MAMTRASTTGHRFAFASQRVVAIAGYVLERVLPGGITLVAPVFVLAVYALVHRMHELLGATRPRRVMDTAAFLVRLKGRAGRQPASAAA